MWKKDQRAGAGVAGIVIDHQAHFKDGRPAASFRTAPVDSRDGRAIDQPIVEARARIINAFDIF